MFSRLVPATVFWLLTCETILVTTAYLTSSYWMIDGDPMVWLTYNGGFVRVTLMVVGVLLGAYFQDLYERVLVPSHFVLMQQISLVFGMAFLFQALLSYIGPSLMLPRYTMMTGSLILLVVLPLWRLAYSQAVVDGFTPERLLFLGSSPINHQIAKCIREKPELGLAPVGIITDVDDGPSDGTEKILGPVSNFREIVQKIRPTRIVVGMLERRNRMPVQELLEANFSGVLVEDAAQTYEAVLGRVNTAYLRPSQLIFSQEFGPRPGTVKLQAVYSFLIALIGLVVALPIMFLVALIVKVTSPGPMFYRQKRVGLNSSVFTLYKFRSMRDNAEEGTGAVWATRGDPRITPVGRWLRKLRLDELPQLFNVVKGEMSIVGPRPERPEFVSTLSEKIPFYKQRHYVKPGITGWAQINHKYGDTFEDSLVKLEYDLYYIKHLTPALDMYVIFHTMKVMLLSRGAQ